MQATKLNNWQRGGSRRELAGKMNVAGILQSVSFTRHSQPAHFPVMELRHPD
jgi:hypothetical protein